MGSVAKGGQPTKYKAEYARQAKKLCELGATDSDLADAFGVNIVTIWRWQGQQAGFCKAVKVGKDLADDRVERAFYHRAVGYDYEAEKVMQYEGEIVRASYREHIPADPGAALNWLKNRQPERWREKAQVEVTGGDAVIAILKAMAAQSSPQKLTTA